MWVRISTADSVESLKVSLKDLWGLGANSMRKLFGKYKPKENECFHAKRRIVAKEHLINCNSSCHCNFTAELTLRGTVGRSVLGTIVRSITHSIKQWWFTNT